MSKVPRRTMQYLGLVADDQRDGAAPRKEMPFKELTSRLSGCPT